MIGLKFKLTSSGYDPDSPNNFDITLDRDWVCQEGGSMDDRIRGTGPGPGKDGNKFTSFLGGGRPEAEVRPGVFKGGDQPVNASTLPPFLALEVGEVAVTPWSPQQADDPAWQATQVHVYQRIPAPDGVGEPLVMITRLKSERATREYIQALVDAYKVAFGARTFA